VENLFEFGRGESTLTDFDEGSDQISNHSIKKAVPLEGEFQKSALLLHDPNGANIANGRFSFVTRIGGERCKVVFPSQNLGGFSQQGEIEGAWDVPGPTDFQRVKRIGVGDPVEVGFSFGREAGVKARFLTSDGEDSDPCREMKVEGFRESGGRMKGRYFAGGNLTEGVHTAIGSARSCNGHGAIKDFLQGFLEGELYGGVGILTLPTEEVLAPIDEKETVWNRLHARFNADRLEARDRRSSR
jgi:hypothetical protein